MPAGHRRTADDLLKARAVNWPEAVTPVSRLLVCMFRFGTLVRDNAARAVAAHEISFTEFEVLITLRSTSPPHELAPTELYGAVLITSGGLTKVLHALERRKLIARGEGETDRRSKPVRLTAKGRALAERAMVDVIRSDGELIAGAISPADLERMTRLLHTLLTRFESNDT
jgi:DNA-binding MarR family transcriptional regulator